VFFICKNDIILASIYQLIFTEMEILGKLLGIVVMKGEEALFIDDNLNVLRKTSWKEGSDFSFQDLMMDHSVSLDLE
jgi:hypothetical protein